MPTSAHLYNHMLFFYMAKVSFVVILSPHETLGSCRDVFQNKRVPRSSFNTIIFIFKEKKKNPAWAGRGATNYNSVSLYMLYITESGNT